MNDPIFQVSKVVGFLASPSNTLAFAMLFGLALGFTRRKRLGQWLYGLGLVGLLVAGLSPLGHWLLAPLEARFPRWQDPGAPPTGIIVLGGSLDTELYGLLGDIALNESAERLTEAVVLARRFPSARLVFSGGEGQLMPRGMREADAAKAFFVSMGMAAERIELEPDSRNTLENAIYTKRIVMPTPGERWLLVTSAWHMPRAMGCFRAVDFPVEPYPVDFRTADPAQFFDAVSKGLRRVDVATREWTGLLINRLTGRSAALFPGP